MNTIENIEPTVKVLPLQTKTEMIVARLNAEYEAERAIIRKKMNEERDCIDAVEVIRNQHKENIRKLQNEEDALRVKWMEEKARILEEAEYNRGNECIKKILHQFLERIRKKVCIFATSSYIFQG